ncbi:MAG: RNA polymerase sporulation sigma factor SigG [Clostridia bacterium]|nr:RNA polymerase sporulation sigma factor SigG [Clostridia bacterium]
MQYNKVMICGVNTAQLKVLKNDETEQLLIKAKNGDKNARNQLINGNLRLVLSVIARFSNRGEQPDDLFQVGCIGLIKAIDNFDTSLDVRFSTYAVPMIIGELRRFLRDNSSIRVSRSIRDTAYKTLQMREKLTLENQREPDVDEIARALNISREDVVMALDAISEPVSLFEPIYSDGTDQLCVMDQVCDTENSDENWLERIALGQAMENLCEREQKILEMRFYRGKTQTEVSSAIGISQAQVSRLEKTALKKIKKSIVTS